MPKIWHNNNVTKKLLKFDKWSLEEISSTESRTFKT